MSVFLQSFKNRTDIINEFQIKPDALRGVRILLAWYGYGGYCGESLVIFERGGRLYEVNASHCSCYGIEGQWEPEGTTPEALLKRTIYDSCDGGTEAQTKLHALAKRLQKRVKK